MRRVAALIAFAILGGTILLIAIIPDVAPTPAVSGAQTPDPAEKKKDVFTWHYEGSAARAELVQDAVKQLLSDCGRLTVYFDHLSKPSVKWLDGKIGPYQNAITFETQLAANFTPPLADGLIKGGDLVTITMVGGDGAGYILIGKPAFFFCEAIPPIGSKPLALKAQSRLSPISLPPYR